MELETFIETQPKPKEIHQKMEKGLVEFKALWSKSTGSQKKRLISALFDGLLLFGDKLGVIPPKNSSDSSNKKGTRGKSPSADTLNPKNSNVIDLPDRTQFPNKNAHSTFAVSCASADKFGGRDWSVDAHSEVVDFIRLSNPPIVSRAPEMAALYESGHSISQIARKFGKAKATIKNSLEVYGVVLRPAIGSKKYLRQGQNKRTSSNPPFGFLLLRNEFTPHPKEIETLREIITLSEQGRGPLQIAKRLNELALPTRSKKPWAHSVVAGIIKRFKANGYPYNELKR